MFKLFLFIVFLLSAGNVFADVAYNLTELLPGLPVKIFDETTEGIESAELNTLLSKGESPNWKITERSSHLVVIKSKHPSSEIKIQSKQFDKPMIEVHVQNERVSKFFYYITINQPPKWHWVSPDVWTRSINEYHYEKLGESGQADYSKYPEDLRKYVYDAEGCQHWMGEVGYDPERLKQIQDAMKKMDCANLAVRTKSLIAKYSTNTNVTGVLFYISKYLGE